MWTVLAPLLIFVVVLLFQLGKQKENFATDASGNIIDASGSSVTTSGSKVAASSSSPIQLTFSDLLKLFSATKPQVQATQPTIKQAIQEVVAKAPDTSAGIYEKIRPSVLQDIKSQLQGAPFEPAAPIASMGGCDAASDAMAQGSELMNAKAGLENNAEYIRKDSIPCYGCSL